jgi:hypothetical protein
MLSNEGFAEREDVLARRMNEVNGEHRFGGGCDGFGDPQVLDMLTAPGLGGADEGDAQHKALSGYTCADEAKKAKLAQISVVRRR